MKTIDEAIAIIRERIEGCEHNERRATNEYFMADSDNGREVATRMEQTATAQRLILQTVLDEILETEQD